jgi:radical SAM superfamily enzyme YgiQ (UPF0313 family)
MSDSAMVRKRGNDCENAALDREQVFQPLGPAPRVLLVWPDFPPSFWTFGAMLELLPEKAILPPLGLITVAALCPRGWQLRLLDLAFDELRDEDFHWADLVMVSAMHVQRDSAMATLARARALGVRTMIGGPYVSSEPDIFSPLADHLVIGEPDDMFPEIASALETGRARHVWRIDEKPDLSCSPVPRYDLLKLDSYASMAVQFSRGCPFQCEFCDIITIYGRRPRTKSVAQLIAELDALREAGWRKQVFLVDDNFIGNQKRALELCLELGEWQKRHGHPFVLYTEASIDLAHRQDLLEAMVRANFFYVFIGVETPDVAALVEAKKFQNLRADPVDCIRFIQRRGLWVTGGFIVGFDSDSTDIFHRQVALIERAAVPWSMTGLLQAPPTTPLFDRMRAEGRLIETSTASSNFSVPNFTTRLPLPVLLEGLRGMLLQIYAPGVFYERAWLSMLVWKPRPGQRAPQLPLSYKLRVILRSLWRQGVLGGYQVHYWRFLARLIWQYRSDTRRMYFGFIILLSGHHFLRYAANVAEDLSHEIQSGCHE